MPGTLIDYFDETARKMRSTKTNASTYPITVVYRGFRRWMDLAFPLENEEDGRLVGYEGKLHWDNLDPDTVEAFFKAFGERDVQEFKLRKEQLYEQWHKWVGEVEEAWTDIARLEQ